MFNKYILVECFNPKRSLKQNYNLIANSPFCSRYTESTSHVVITVTTFSWFTVSQTEPTHFTQTIVSNMQRTGLGRYCFYPNLQIRDTDKIRQLVQGHRQWIVDRKQGVSRPWTYTSSAVVTRNKKWFWLRILDLPTSSSDQQFSKV